MLLMFAGMFVFPILYCLLFLMAFKGLVKDQVKQLVYFIIFGLSIYTTSLSVLTLYGLKALVPFFQTFKEISILAYLIYLFVHLKTKIQLHLVDKLMLAFFAYVLLYVFLPIGSYGLFQKILAFKSLCFFPLVYFTGRIIAAEKINLLETFHLIGLLLLVASGILLIELITNTHLQSISGYALYNQVFFGQEPHGSYDLSWTFEIETGAKRFASLFSQPLEFAEANLVGLAAMAALITYPRNQIRLTNFTVIALACSLFGILFALSRASFASYFIIIYAYAILTRQKTWLKFFHLALLTLAAFFFIFTLKGDLIDFIIHTITFSNASSVGHIIEWMNGVNSMVSHPLGIGLGESGRISAIAGENIGGENQFVILGVQTGIIGLGLYVSVYFYLLKLSYQAFQTSKGKLRRLALFLLLIKIGLFIPLFTSEVETVIYVSYLIWFLSGLFINLLVQQPSNTTRVANNNNESINPIHPTTFNHQ